MASMRARAGAVLATTLVLALGALPSPRTALAAGTPPTPADPGLAALEQLVAASQTAGLAVLPVDGNAALATAANAVSLDLGVPANATAAVTAAGLPNDIAARLAVVLQDIHVCDLASAAAVKSLGLLAPASGTIPAPSAAAVAGIRQCGATMYSDGLTLQSWLQPRAASDAAAGKPGYKLDIWPVVNLDTSTTDHTFLWDYALLVGNGNNNTFLNNAGGNLIDVRRSPQSSAIARGCEKVDDFLANPNPECVPAAAMLIETGSGKDVFGQMQSPDPAEVNTPASPADYACTSGLLVRRIALEGSGILGAGILINSSAKHSTYLGKIAAQGTGHVGGVGILDIQGDNTLSAVRNSQGFGFISGLGVLRIRGATDGNGNTANPPSRDSVGTYMPVGGVVSDKDVCDDTPRNIQGAGELGGAGAMLLRNTRATVSSDTALAQGSGGSPAGGFGLLLAMAGANAYSGVPNRAPDTTYFGPGSNTLANAFADCDSMIGATSGSPSGCDTETMALVQSMLP